jgi:hypothetical protein
LLEDDDSAKSALGALNATRDPLHAADIDSVLAAGYKISSVANRETVMIVVGNGLWQELLDRPAAQILQRAVNDIGKTRLRRAIILPYTAWEITSEVHTNPAIAVGGPVVNPLTNLLKDNNRYEMEPDIFGSWEVHLGMPRVALWGADPRGTVRAVERYVERPEGLQAFLRQSWK